MSELRIVDVVDAEAFGLVPPCADARFDHRTCDYWEDADRGSRAHRESWLRPQGQPSARSGPRPRADPFGIDPDQAASDIAAAPANPFLPTAPPARVANPFASGRDADGFGDSPFAAPPRADNPFAPAAPAPGPSSADLPRKLALLSRGLRVFGTYARVLLVDDVAVAYAQFGPLSAYPRASRVRELYRQLPDAPLPAVITCIATTPEARGGGHALRLVTDVCDDLARRGFTAVEAYPEAGLSPDATSAATPAFWVRAGFAVVVDDERFPVVRREL
jgi:hypothetical protein